MSTVFDTHAAVKRLQEAGVDERTATLKCDITVRDIVLYIRLGWDLAITTKKWWQQRRAKRPIEFVANAVRSRCRVPDACLTVK